VSSERHSFLYETSVKDHLCDLLLQQNPEWFDLVVLEHRPVVECCCGLPLQGSVSGTVHDAQAMQQYVWHSVTLNSGAVSVGDTVMLLIDEVHLFLLVFVSFWFNMFVYLRS